MVRVLTNKSLLFCLRYDPLIVFRRQNHITFIFIKMMLHDLLVQMAYCTIQWIAIYPVDSAIYLLNNWGLYSNRSWATTNHSARSIHIIV